MNPCLICGHVVGEHMTCSSGAYWCNGPGCPCAGFEPAADIEGNPLPDDTLEPDEFGGDT